VGDYNVTDDVEQMLRDLAPRLRARARDAQADAVAELAGCAGGIRRREARRHDLRARLARHEAEMEALAPTVDTSLTDRRAYDREEAAAAALRAELAEVGPAGPPPPIEEMEHMKLARRWAEHARAAASGRVVGDLRPKSDLVDRTLWREYPALLRAARYHGLSLDPPADAAAPSGRRHGHDR
jgi:hypothetical protein